MFEWDLWGGPIQTMQDNSCRVTRPCFKQGQRMKSFESEPLGGSDSDRVIGLDGFGQSDDIPS